MSSEASPYFLSSACLRKDRLRDDDKVYEQGQAWLLWAEPQRRGVLLSSQATQRGMIMICSLGRVRETRALHRGHGESVRRLSVARCREGWVPVGEEEPVSA